MNDLDTWWATHGAIAVTVRGESTGATVADYRVAPSGGPLHAAWTNKPHRLVYDLCLFAVDQQAEITRLRAELEARR